jgi:hypothetical protein
MTELEIPERALDLAYEIDDIDEAFKIAAPIIVATELRRLAGSYEPALRNARFHLKARADELDPPAAAR